jgi:hypothetical protein
VELRVIRGVSAGSQEVENVQEQKITSQEEGSQEHEEQVQTVQKRHKVVRK